MASQSLALPKHYFPLSCGGQIARPQSFEQWISQPLGNTPSPPKTDTSLPILIVGAGAAGLAISKELKAHGIRFEWVEAHSSVGGVWDKSNPESPIYTGVSTNSSRVTTHLGELMPKEGGDYPTGDQAQNYLQDFAKKHQLLEHIQFNTLVDGPLVKTAHGTWLVALKFKDGKSIQKEFRAVIMAVGTHNKRNAIYPPELMESAKQAGLLALHACDVGSAENAYDIYSGKIVVVQGAGNSGTEIATKISTKALKTILSYRTPPWIVPLYVGRKPADEFAAGGPPVPHWLEMFIFHVLQRHYIGHPRILGFDTPAHGLLDRLPVSDRGIVEAILSGKVEVRSEVKSIENGVAYFKNEKDTPLKIDSIVFATGYNKNIPFLPKEYGDLNDPNFYPPFLIFHPTEPGLAFMNEAFVPQGTWPMYVEQAKALAAYYLAEAEGAPNVAIFNKLRNLIPPDYKGHLFSDADETHVDTKIYTKFLRYLTEWLKTSR